MERADLDQWKTKEVARLLALVETERRYFQEIVASVPVGLLVLSSDLSIVSSNRAFKKIFGIRNGEGVRGRPDALLPSSVLDRVHEVLNTGAALTGLLAETPLNGGRSLRLGIQGIPGWGDEAEQEVLLTIEDLTGLSLPATEPAHPARLLPAMAEAMPASALADNLEAAIWAVEVPSMRFQFVNEHAWQLLGLEVRHWLDTEGFWAERIHPADRESVLQSYQRAIRHPLKRGRVAGEYRSIRADNRMIWVYETARVIADPEGRADYIVGVSIDISQRRRLEDQLVQANRVDAVAKLASRLAHDLNNILMIVGGYAEELSHALPAASPLRADAREILEAADRITSLTNQMLTFTRYQTTPSVTVELGAALKEMEWSLQEALGQTIVLEYSAVHRPLPVRVEPEQLQQVMSAFVRHARETMPSGGKLEIRAAWTTISDELRRPDATLRPGDYAVLTIADTGLPYDAQSRAAMFESFLPGKESTEEAGPALARAYALLRQWGGDISVANAPVNGTVFEAFLPLAALDAPKDLASKEQKPVSKKKKPEPGSETVLVVEDEAGIRALITKILRRDGYEVLESETGMRALEICRERGLKIDLLITDVMMAEMGGPELVRQLRAQRSDLKVLYISGFTDDPAIYAEPLPPHTSYLQKPFTLRALLDKVKEVLATQ